MRAFIMSNYYYVVVTNIGARVHTLLGNARLKACVHD